MEAIFAKYASSASEDHSSMSGTDKDTAHSYLPVYEKILGPLRNSPLRLLEIGVMTGASLCVWDEYFTHSDKDIHGADIMPEWLKYKVNNYHVVDATKVTALDELPGEWDVIIDDASHNPYDQLLSLQIFGPKIKQGGYYIIEDIQNFEIAKNLFKIAVPDYGFDGTIYDQRAIKNRYDDIMLVLQKK